MSCHVETTEYQLHLYDSYPPSAPDCWSNPNIFLVAPDANGTYSAQAPQVTIAFTNQPYFFVARIANRGTNTQLLEMLFGIPSFMLVSGENQKEVSFRTPARISSLATVNVPSVQPIQFIHPGNYEISVQIKNWRNPDLSVGAAPPDDWPKKGALYARNSIMVKS